MSDVNPNRRNFVKSSAMACAGGIGLYGLRARAQADNNELRDELSAQVRLTGTARQSGTLLGQVPVGATVQLDDLTVRADVNGRFVLGFDRDAPPESTLKVQYDGQSIEQIIHVASRTYQVRTIGGLPSATVNPPPDVMARIGRESELKQVAYLSVDDRATGYLGKFSWPLRAVRITSPWGAQRNLNGSLQRPHYGIDLGAATGTPIMAPGNGIVILAENDMFYEGAMVSIDHGQGLITNYLHMSRIDVHVGQRVAVGDILGAVGARGRATGPHLCWRMRWRGRQLDPSLKV